VAIDQAADREAARTSALKTAGRALWPSRYAREDVLQIARRWHEELHAMLKPGEQVRRVHRPPRFDRRLHAPQQPGPVRRMKVRIVEIEDDRQRTSIRLDGRRDRRRAGPALLRPLDPDGRLEEVRDLGRLAVHAEVEVLPLEPPDRTTLPVGNDDVDFDDLNIDLVHDGPRRSPSVLAGEADGSQDRKSQRDQSGRLHVSSLCPNSGGTSAQYASFR